MTTPTPTANWWTRPLPHPYIDHTHHSWFPWTIIARVIPTTFLRFEVYLIITSKPMKEIAPIFHCQYRMFAKKVLLLWMLVWLQHEKDCFTTYLPYMEGKAMVVAIYLPYMEGKAALLQTFCNLLYSLTSFDILSSLQLLTARSSFSEPKFY